MSDWPPRFTAEEADLTPAAGFVAEEVLQELPGLRIDWVSVTCARRRSSPAVAKRLGDLSNRLYGASAVAMRTHAVPQAYRAFFRQIGLDPDVDRIPSEQAAVARLLHGRFRSQDLVQDALLLALIETGVPVWALDADRVAAGGLGIRAARPGERIGSAPSRSGGSPGQALEAGQLVVVDAEGVQAVLFGNLSPDSAVGPATERIILFSVGVEGVPAIHVEEALWLGLEALGA